MTNTIVWDKKLVGSITLNQDQQNALEAITGFLIGPETMFVVRGYSGAGKSTLIAALCSQFNPIQKMAKLIDPNVKHKQLVLSATTNKAADALSSITGEIVKTVHSILQLHLTEDLISRKPHLKKMEYGFKLVDTVLVIDEASMIDEELMNMIATSVSRTKIIFIGDPDQLIPEEPADIFNKSISQAVLNTVVRQADGNPIKKIGEELRKAVHTKNFPSIHIDGKYLIHCSETDFNRMIETEFVKPNWEYTTSKVIARTNKIVTTYNSRLWQVCKGRTYFDANDYVVNNSFVPGGTNMNLKTDELVKILKSTPDRMFDVEGRSYLVRNQYGQRTVFVPYDYNEKTNVIDYFREMGKREELRKIQHTWADLRPVYASTVHKAQGSTFDRVFIDLDDLGGCWDKSQLARLLYVAVTRAREQVIFKGDI